MKYGMPNAGTLEHDILGCAEDELVLEYRRHLATLNALETARQMSGMAMFEKTFDMGLVMSLHLSTPISSRANWCRSKGWDRIDTDEKRVQFLLRWKGMSE